MNIIHLKSIALEYWFLQYHVRHLQFTSLATIPVELKLSPTQDFAVSGCCFYLQLTFSTALLIKPQHSLDVANVCACIDYISATQALFKLPTHTSTHAVLYRASAPLSITDAHTHTHTKVSCLSSQLCTWGRTGDSITLHLHCWGL